MPKLHNWLETCLGVAVVFVLVLFAPGTSGAVATQFTNITLFTSDGIFGSLTDLIGPVPRGVTVSGGGFAGTANAYVWSANFSALARYGVLEIFGQTETDGRGAVLGTARAETQDTLTITNNALTSQAGVVHATIFLDGSASASRTNTSVGASGSWDFAALANGSVFLNESQSQAPGCGQIGCNTPDVSGLFAVDIPFIFGSPFILTLEVSGQTNAGIGATSPGPGGASASFDLAHSIDWGGISSVTSNGVAVPYSLTSESGFDWSMSQIPTTSVPEPSSWILVAFGVVVRRSFMRRKAQDSMN